ncbi:MAG: hypothetical protein NXI04_04335 [Planctomycetaceae bacterium]|nr:hypothetical protein [Planctomycetaceae bacterium]
MRSFFQCNFCRLNLKRLSFSRLRFADRVLMFLGLPVYQCPHCFGCSRKPWIPQWLLTVLSGPAKTAEDSTETVTDDDCGPITIPLAPQPISDAVAATAQQSLTVSHPSTEAAVSASESSPVGPSFRASIGRVGTLPGSPLLEQA